MSTADVAQRRRTMLAQIESMAEASLGRALDPRVMAAVAAVPREAYVPLGQQAHAYENRPLPIGSGKTISQPFIVALMSDLLDPKPGDRVLEVGTGCGYQTAVLAALSARVYSIERIAALADEARQRLANLGVGEVQTRVGDGFLGWPAMAPFDRIIVTAAPAQVPAALVEQLRPGGRLVLPVGPDLAQELTVVDKDEAGRVSTRAVLPVRFSALD